MKTEDQRAKALSLSDRPSVLTDLVLLVFEDGDFEELRVLDADAAKCQVALENLGNE